MLNIHERRLGEVTILDLDGDLREEDCTTLRRHIYRLTGEKRYWIVINLEKVSILGSHALGLLLFADREARQGGGKLKLLKPQPMLAAIFHSTRTKFLLEVFDNEKSAVESF